MVLPFDDLSYSCHFQQEGHGFKTKLHHRVAYKLVGRFFDAVIAVSEPLKKRSSNATGFPRKGFLPSTMQLMPLIMETHMMASP